MVIESKQEQEALTVKLTGRLDTTSAPELENYLKGALDGVGDLTIDVNGLEYISSAGLRVLLSTQKRMRQQGAMRLTGVNETVQEILDITGFSDILTIV